MFFQLLDRKTPAERLHMVGQMNRTVRALTVSGLRERYPHESDEQLRVRLADLLYGAEAASMIAGRLAE